jgi:hypothetical protein
METARSSQLLLLATEEQVHAFDLAAIHRITLGRHESNDVQLNSRTVSNFHAEITNEDSSIVLRDLGSTNGTYVGDRRIEEATSIANGDRLRIGNHVMVMQLKPAVDSEDGFIRYRREPPSWGPGSKGRVISLRARTADGLKTLRLDDPNDLSLPDLLNRVARTGSPLRVRLERENDRCHLFATKNRIIHAENGTIVGEKALYRIFCWQDFRYEVEAIENPAGIPRTIALPTETLIMDGMKQVLELGKLIAELPPMEVPLRLKEDCPLPLTAHSPAEIQIFQAIIRQQTIGAVMESSPLTDVRVLRLIESLLRKGVFEVAREDPSLQETFISPPGEVSPLRSIPSDS